MFLQSLSTMLVLEHFLQMVLHPLLMSYGLSPRTLPLWKECLYYIFIIYSMFIVYSVYSVVYILYFYIFIFYSVVYSVVYILYFIYFIFLYLVLFI